MAGFVGDANLVDGEAAGDRAATAVGPVPLAAPIAIEGPARVLVRPEELGIEAGDTATVEVLEFYGHDSVYVVRLDDGGPAASADRVAARVPAGRPGARCPTPAPRPSPMP